MPNRRRCVNLPLLRGLDYSVTCTVVRRTAASHGRSNNPFLQGARFEMADIPGKYWFRSHERRFEFRLSDVWTLTVKSKLAGENAFGYLELFTDSDLKGVGWSFTNGQGNE